MRLARVATVLTGAAAAYGLRAWRRDREGRAVWAGATDGLPEQDSPQERTAAPDTEPRRGTEGEG